MRSPKKYLVLDASAIVNFWLNPGVRSPIARMFQAAETSAAQLWITAAMIPTLENVSVRRFKKGVVPLHIQPVFANSGLKEGCLPISEAAAKRVMSLPMGADLMLVDLNCIASYCYKDSRLMGADD